MYSRLAQVSAITGAILFNSIGCSTVPRYTREERTVRPSITKRNNKITGKSVSNNYKLQGIASYYGQEFHGKKTASGEKFNMHAFTAAHRNLPFNTRVKVTNTNNGKSVVVRINDRGPYKKGRIIDLSIAAAKKIGLIETGTAKVKLSVLKSFL